MKNIFIYFLLLINFQMFLFANNNKINIKTPELPYALTTKRANHLDLLQKKGKLSLSKKKIQ